MKIDTAPLDGLRGLASMQVALGHMFIFSMAPTRGTDFGGGLVMGLFFLVSGVVMVLGYGQREYKVALPCFPNMRSQTVLPQQEVTETKTEGSLFDSKRFWAKRVARLLPIYYLTNIIALPIKLMSYPTAASAIPEFVVTMLMLTSWSLMGPTNGVLWTISTMAFFYVVFPFLEPVLQKLNSVQKFESLAKKMYLLQIGFFFAVMILYTAVLKVPLTDKNNFYYWTWRFFPLCRLPVFIMGCCLGHSVLILAKGGDEYDCYLLCCCSAKNSTRPYVAGLLIWTLAIIGFAAIGLIAYSGAFRVLGEVFSPMLFYDLILLMLKPKTKGTEMSLTERFLRIAPLQFLGRISYSFYACHFVVIQYLGLLIYAAGHNGAIPDRGKIGLDALLWSSIPSWAIPLCIALTVLVGWLVTDYVEGPLANYVLVFLLGANANAPAAKVFSESTGGKDQSMGAQDCVAVPFIGSPVSKDMTNEGSNIDQTSASEGVDIGAC
jgi:peptidoglycan/LPS O-acetylase OafA/YrhL